MLIKNNKSTKSIFQSGLLLKEICNPYFNVIPQNHVLHEATKNFLE